MYVLEVLQVVVVFLVVAFFISTTKMYFRLNSKVDNINLDDKRNKLDELNNYFISFQLETDKKLLEQALEFNRIKDKLRDFDLANKKKALQIKYTNELNKRVESIKSEDKKEKQPKKETKNDLGNEDVKSVWSKIISNPYKQIVETKIKDKKELTHYVNIIMQDKYGLSLQTFRKKNYKAYKSERDKVYSKLYYHCLTKGKSLESYMKYSENKTPKNVNENIF